jgi:hypothetical protein
MSKKPEDLNLLTIILGHIDLIQLLPVKLDALSDQSRIRYILYFLDGNLQPKDMTRVGVQSEDDQMAPAIISTLAISTLRLRGLNVCGGGVEPNDSFKCSLKSYLKADSAALLRIL